MYFRCTYFIYTSVSSVYYEHAWCPWRSEEGVGCHGTGVTKSRELPRGFKVCSSEEQPVLLAGEASLKPPHAAAVVVQCSWESHAILHCILPLYLCISLNILVHFNVVCFILFCFLKLGLQWPNWLELPQAINTSRTWSP